MTGQKARVTVITVTHNGSGVIGDMLASLPAEVPLVIVDNASRDHTLEIVGRLRPDAKIHRNTVGLGYGNAMNLGLKEVATEFALLINPDTTVLPGAIDRLIEAADVYPDAAMIGPKVLNPDGSVELSHNVEIQKRRNFGRRDREAPPEGPVCAESLSGVVVLARMECLRAVQFFDREYFLYYEEDDMCMRMRRAGYSLVLEPAAVFSHLGGGSVPATPAYHWEKFWHLSWSRLYYERKYRGVMSMLGVCLADAPRYALKALGYSMILNRTKARRDAARCVGMLAFVAGIRASRVAVE